MTLSFVTHYVLLVLRWSMIFCCKDLPLVFLRDLSVTGVWQLYPLYSIHHIFHVLSQLYACAFLWTKYWKHCYFSAADGWLISTCLFGTHVKAKPALSLKFPRFELCFESKNIGLHKPWNLHRHSLSTIRPNRLWHHNLNELLCSSSRHLAMGRYKWTAVSDVS
jgi:hypothetical protein